MTNALSIGVPSAEPGTRTRGTVPADIGTRTVVIPLTLVNGSRPGPRVVITAGVHGGEFTGVDAATRLAAVLEPGEAFYGMRALTVAPRAALAAIAAPAPRDPGY